MCFGCGLENSTGLQLFFYDNDRDQVVAEVTLGPRHQGYPGIAHGGIVAAILDEIGGRTAMIGNHRRFFVTAKMDIRYKRPVPLGPALRASGRLIERRGRLTIARAEIRAADGSLLAQAQVVLADLPAGAVVPDLDDVLGWQVYPRENLGAGAPPAPNTK
jgi:uncharacterized protein (TIGR00369 family)